VPTQVSAASNLILAAHILAYQIEVMVTDIRDIESDRHLLLLEH